MYYNTELFIKVALVIVCGGLIGFEREKKSRPAGFRTHILVCMGSMTIAHLSTELFQYYHTHYNTIQDPARLGAQVISGIGFLGAGTIIRYSDKVKGLTTSASLWTMAAIGLSIGYGFYFTAITVTVSIFATLFMFSLGRRLLNKRKNIYEFGIRAINKAKVVGAINITLAKTSYKVLDLDLSYISDSDVDDKNSSLVFIHLLIDFDDPKIKKEDIQNLIEEIKSIPGVMTIEQY